MRQMLPMPFAGGMVLLDEQHQLLHLLNPAAAAIWTLLDGGLTHAEAAEVLASHSGRTAESFAGDIAAMQAQWGADSSLTGISVVPPPIAPLMRDGDGVPAYYNVGGVGLEFFCENARLAGQVAAALGECDAPSGGATLRVLIRITADNGYELLVDDAPWLMADDSGEIVGGLYHLLLQRRWGEDGWLTMIHGAALARDGTAIVMPGKSGSGKTTLAAYLSRRGFDFLADDLAAVRADGRVVPWPTRLSIKRGSWRTLADALPELEDLPEREVARRRVKLVPAGRDAWARSPVPVRALILPRWSEQDPAAVMRLDPFEALAALVEDRVWAGWPMTEESVRALLDWLDRVPAWQLRYPDLGTAETQVSEVMDALPSATH